MADAWGDQSQGQKGGKHRLCHQPGIGISPDGHALAFGVCCRHRLDGDMDMDPARCVSVACQYVQNWE